MEQQTLQSTSAAFADVLGKKEISSSFPAQMVVHIKTGAACLAYLFVSLLLFLLFAHCVLSVSCVSSRLPRVVLRLRKSCSVFPTLPKFRTSRLLLVQDTTTSQALNREKKKREQKKMTTLPTHLFLDQQAACIVCVTELSAF